MPEGLDREFLRHAARLFETDTIMRDPRVPDPVTREWLAGQADNLERLIRRQYHDGRPADTDEHPIPDGQLPPDWERELERFGPATMVGALRRWAYLKHLLRVHQQRLRPTRGSAEATEDQLLAAYQLVRREPVTVRLSSGQQVQVTDRSLPCLVEIARHASRLHDIQLRLEHADEIRSRLLGRLEELAEERAALDSRLRTRLTQARRPWAKLRRWREHRRDVKTLRRERSRLRGRIQWIDGFRDALLQEAGWQRQALYAHVFVEHGTPTALDQVPEDVPWETFTAADDVALLEAVHEAGVGRTERLGPMPEPPKRKDEKGRFEYLENFGWISALTRWGIKMPVHPAEWHDEPLGRTAALFRLGADPVYVEK